MKKFWFSFIMAFLITITIAFFTFKNEKVIKVSDNNIQQASKDTIKLSQSEYNSLQRLSPAAKDVAIYFISNRDNWRSSDFVFYCGKYEIWIGSGYQHLKIWNPVRYELNDLEKDYFWSLYNTYQRKDMRLYNYESEIEIILEN